MHEETGQRYVHRIEGISDEIFMVEYLVSTDEFDTRVRKILCKYLRKNVETSDDVFLHLAVRIACLFSLLFSRVHTVFGLKLAVQIPIQHFPSKSDRNRNDYQRLGCNTINPDPISAP